MGLAFRIDEEEVGRSKAWVDLLVESLKKTYIDSVKEALRAYEFNFVISDPRLPENPIVYASEGFCRMSGYSKEEVLGRNCRFLQGPGTDRRTVLELRDAIREERAAQVRILNYTKERKPFWILFHLAPVFSGLDGTVIHFVGVQTPISSQLASSRPEKERIPSRLILDSGPAENSFSTIDKLNDIHQDLGRNGVFPEWECTAVDAADSGNCHDLRMCSGKDVHGHDNDTEAAVTCLLGGGAGESEGCRRQEPQFLEATGAMRTLVSELVRSSNGKGDVRQSRGKQLSERNGAGVVSSSLMLSLSRIQQSFVLADPHLPDTPIVHASDLFLHLTGYNREEVVGRNCRFLQGPGTDLASVKQIRDSMRVKKPCSVRLLNYRKDKRPFWNLLHVSPVRCSEGKVAFFVGVQLQVSAADEEQEEFVGMSAQMKQLSAVGAVRVAVRSLQGVGLRRSIRNVSP